MTQTTKYKLNLIQLTDTFSPDPLNENMTRVDAALDAIRAEAAAGLSSETQARIAAVSTEAQTRASADTAETQARIAADNAEAQARANAINAEAQTRAAAVSALDQRLKTEESHKLVAGTYTGNAKDAATWQTISLDFTPTAVLISNVLTGTGSTVAGLALSGQPYAGAVEIISGGFRVSGYVDINTITSTNAANSSGTVYRYIAFC